MTIREAMNIINGALDSLYEYTESDLEKENFFDEISKAEAMLEKLVQAEEQRPEEYWAVCPDCGHELNYYDFEYDDYDEDEVTFLASGYCPHCQKDYSWRELFKLTKIEFDN